MRRMAHVVLLLAAFLLGLGACSRSLEVGTYMDPSQGDYPVDRALGQILSEYQERRPRLEIRIRVMRWDTMAQEMIADPAAAPDLQWIPQEDLAAALGAGVIYRAGGTLQKKDRQDFLWWTADRSHPVVMVQPDVYGLIYRADLFRQEGVTVPFADWGDLSRAAAQMTGFDDVLDIDRYGLGVALSERSGDLPILASLMPEIPSDPWATPRGARAAGPDGDSSNHPMPPVEPGDAAAVAAGIRRIQAWRDTFAMVHPESLSQTQEDVYLLLNGGTFAMVYGATSRIPRVRREIVVADPEEVRFMGLPSDRRGRGSPPLVQGWYVGVNRNSRHRREARRLLRFMTGPEADRIWVTVGEQVPLRRSTAVELEDELQEPGRRYLGIAAAMAPGRHVAGSGALDRWVTALRMAGAQALRGDVEPAEALISGWAEVGPPDKVPSD